MILGARGVIAPLADAAIRHRIADGAPVEYSTRGGTACYLDVVASEMISSTSSVTPSGTVWAVVYPKPVVVLAMEIGDCSAQILISCC